VVIHMIPPISKGGFPPNQPQEKAPWRLSHSVARLARGHSSKAAFRTRMPPSTGNQA